MNKSLSVKRILFVLVLVGLVFGALQLWNSGALDLPGRTEKARKKLITFDTVRMRVYDERGAAQADVFAEKITTDKNFRTLHLGPRLRRTATAGGPVKKVRAVFYRNGGVAATLTSKEAHKTLKSRVERVDFKGEVELLSPRPAMLQTELLRYYVADGSLEAPTRATITTTTSVIKGDTIRTTAELKRGIVKGNVEILSNQVPAITRPRSERASRGD